MLGRYDEAEAALRQAITAYRKAKDTHGEAIALTVRINRYTKQGDHRRALQATHEARTFAERHGFARNLILLLIEEGHVQLRLGDAGEGSGQIRAARSAMRSPRATVTPSFTRTTASGRLTQHSVRTTRPSSSWGPRATT